MCWSKKKNTEIENENAKLKVKMASLSSKNVEISPAKILVSYNFYNTDAYYYVSASNSISIISIDYMLTNITFQQANYLG